MAQINLDGMGVALVTPFRPDKSIDFPALGNLIEYQIKSGTDYLVVLGTTAETPTLSSDERRMVREFVAEHAAGRVSLILGCGGNNTAAVIEEMGKTDLTPFSAILSVVPCYNKPSQEGIYRHYCAIDDACPLPMVLYNVPGRTGVNMTSETTLRLAAERPSIIGIKEASGHIQQVDAIIKNRPSTDFKVISGDDGIAYPLMTMGASGVISVIGNAYPREFSRMIHLCLEGKYPEALKIHHRFTELFSLLFVDGNPAGVKCALNIMGMIENELRLPLVPTRVTTHEKITEVLERIKTL